MGIQVNRFSINNPYAYNYYNACDAFNKIQREVKEYEQATTDRKSSEYKQMINKFDYWKHEVPEKSNLAENYENKMNKQANNRKDNGHGGTLNFLA